MPYVEFEARLNSCLILQRYRIEFQVELILTDKTTPRLGGAGWLMLFSLTRALIFVANHLLRLIDKRISFEFVRRLHS